MDNFANSILDCFPMDFFREEQGTLPNVAYPGTWDKPLNTLGDPSRTTVVATTETRVVIDLGGIPSNRTTTSEINKGA